MTTVYSKDPQTDRSLRHSVRDGLAYSVMAGAGETYFAAYALLLRATTAQISLLAALPALLGSAAQLLSAWLSRYLRRRKPLILAGVLVQTLTWLPIVWLPYVFPDDAVAILIGCVVVYYAGGSFATPVWNSLMGDLVPERRRGRFFGRRTRLMSMISFVSLIIAGVLLHLFEGGGHARFGFSLVFLLAGAARAYSFYHITRMHEPAPVSAGFTLPPVAGLARRLRESHFARFALFFALMNFTVAISSPFFTVYQLRDLNFSYLQFTASTAASVLAQFLTLKLWGRVADAFGNRLVMKVTGSVIPWIPALWLISPNFWYIVGLQALGGVCWAGFSLSTGNYLYDVVAAEKRAVYTAIHNVLSNGAIFGGALLGGLIAALAPTELTVLGVGLQWTSSLWAVLVLSSVGRGLVAVLLMQWLREVRSVRRMSAGELVFRMIRINALTGLVSDVLALRRKKDAGGAQPAAEPTTDDKT